MGQSLGEKEIARTLGSGGLEQALRGCVIHPLSPSLSLSVHLGAVGRGTCVVAKLKNIWEISLEEEYDLWKMVFFISSIRKAPDLAPFLLSRC